MKNILKVTKEEAIPASMMTLVFAVLQGFVIRHFFDAVAHRLHGNGSDFIDAMPVSGFDAYTYSMLVDWNIVYDLYRHPLIAFFFYPFYLLNQGLIWLTGINCAQFIVAAILLVGIFYSYIFMYRIFRELLGLCRFDANLLSVMLYSFAYVMVSMLVPDHFGISMPLLIMALYISGSFLKEDKRFTILQTWLLFIPITGVTLSNGVKIFLNVLFVNGKRFFNIRYQLLTFFFFSCLFGGILFFERDIRVSIFQVRDKALRKELYSQIADTISVKDKNYIKAVYERELNRRIWKRFRLNHQKKYNQFEEKRVPIANTRLLQWTDMSISRKNTLVENFFGESLQLHRRNLLQDISKGRPFIVRYYDSYNYVVEFILLLLFFGGILYGRNSKFMWMCLAGMFFDIFLHIVIGFGIDEVYIMTAHWAFTLPIVYGYLLKNKRKWVPLSRILLIALTVYLWIYNVSLFMDYVR